MSAPLRELGAPRALNSQRVLESGADRRRGGGRGGVGRFGLRPTGSVQPGVYLYCSYVVRAGPAGARDKGAASRASLAGRLLGVGALRVRPPRPAPRRVHLSRVCASFVGAVQAAIGSRSGDETKLWHLTNISSRHPRAPSACLPSWGVAVLQGRGRLGSRASRTAGVLCTRLGVAGVARGRRLALETGRERRPPAFLRRAGTPMP